MKIKDYLVLKDIEWYLEKTRDDLIRENNGYSNNPIEEIKTLLNGLKKVITKLGNEE